MPAEKVILHQPPAAWGLPNPSPFCAKLETYLRMAEIPFEPEHRFSATHHRVERQCDGAERRPDPLDGDRPPL